MRKGQGSLEYLLILAAILAIAVVVVIVANSMTGPAEDQVDVATVKYNCALEGIELGDYDGGDVSVVNYAGKTLENAGGGVCDHRAECEVDENTIYVGRLGGELKWSSNDATPEDCGGGTPPGCDSLSSVKDPTMKKRYYNGGEVDWAEPSYIGQIGEDQVYSWGTTFNWPSEANGKKIVEVIVCGTSNDYTGGVSVDSGTGLSDDLSESTKCTDELTGLSLDAGSRGESVTFTWTGSTVSTWSNPTLQVVYCA